MRILRAYSGHCYLLESAEDNKQWGRYSFLGYEPVMELTCINGRMTVTRGGESSEKTVETRSVAHPGEVIRDILEAYKSPRLEGMPPFTGGLVGYFSYDYIKYGEPVLDCESDDPSDMDFRDVDLMLFDKVIVFDNYRQKLMLITGVDPAALESSYRQAERGLEEMESLLKSGARAAFKPLRLKEEMEPCFSEPVFCDMVRKAKHYIREGDIFQVVLSNPMEARAEGSLFDTYRVLRTTNPSPYMFYFSSDDIEVAGASPETLVRPDVIRHFAGRIPIFGVCLGHQAICQAFGARISYAGELMHGKASKVEFDTGDILFKDLEKPVIVARYHSLTAVRETMPEELQVTAWTQDGEVMAVRHRKYDIYGVQFHPESVMTLQGEQMIRNFLKYAGGTEK